MFIASGAYSGYLPKAPGTWGSAAGVILWLLIFQWLSLPAYLGLLAVLFVLGILSAGAAEKIVDSGDPGLVVIDEIVGQLIALIAITAEPIPILLAFLAFRLFDISKPFPVGWCDKHLHGGLGIMLDDVIAGIYALLAVQLIMHILKSF